MVSPMTAPATPQPVSKADKVGRGPKRVESARGCSDLCLSPSPVAASPLDIAWQIVFGRGASLVPYAIGLAARHVLARR